MSLNQVETAHSPRWETAKTILRGAGYTTAALVAIGMLIGGSTLMGFGVHQAAPFTAQVPGGWGLPDQTVQLIPMPMTEL